MLPAFSNEGLLPPGDYELTIEELKKSVLVVGPGATRPDWDFAHRLKLGNNLEIVARQLWEAGIMEIYINGSFVERKNRPNDIDGYFVCDLRDHLSGTWSGGSTSWTPCGPGDGVRSTGVALGN